MIKSIIHVIFATNDGFCQHTAVVIASLLDNNKDEDIALHIFTIDCKQENLDKIKQVADSFSAAIRFYNVSKELFKDFSNPGTYSWACYLRLLTPSLLPNLEKALYLDVDIVVSGNIRELWEKDISDYSLAAVQDSILSYNIVKDYIGYDYYQEGYINSGVLLINLAYWREHNIQQKLTDYLNTHSVKLPDQDAINAILHGTIKFIHPRWNAQASYFTLPPRVVLSQKKYIKRLWTGAIIIHFTGPFKAWYRECVNPYKHLYEKYLDFTPWKRTPSLYLKSWFEGNIFIFLCYIRNMMAYLCSWFYK